MVVLRPWGFQLHRSSSNNNNKIGKRQATSRQRKPNRSARTSCQSEIKMKRSTTQAQNRKEDFTKGKSNSGHFIWLQAKSRSRNIFVLKNIQLWCYSHFTLILKIYKLSNIHKSRKNSIVKCLLFKKKKDKHQISTLEM